MHRPKRIVLLVSLAVGVAAAGALAWSYFAPKPEEDRQEEPVAGRALKIGVLQDGEPLHHAMGTLRLVDAGAGRHFLRFEGYDATPGPDVYFYLTPKAHATTTAEVEGEGVKIRTPTMMGQATLRGDFNVELPSGLDPSRYEGLAVWCDRYNTLFGYAELTPEA